MTRILPDVDKALLEVIRENLAEVPTNAILLTRTLTPPKKTPAVRLWNKGFTASDSSIGTDGPEVGEVLEDEHNGDGQRGSFKLSTLPLRPLVSVECPRSVIRREGRDFKVDYKSGVVSFVEPPDRGRGNVIIRYRSGKGAGELKAMKMTLEYDLDVWSSEAEEQSALVNQIAILLLRARETLASKGIQVRLTKGSDIMEKDAVPDGLYCKRLVCIAEANLLVKVPIPRIEQIELKQVETVRTRPTRERKDS